MWGEVRGLLTKTAMKMERHIKKKKTQTSEEEDEEGICIFKRKKKE